MNRSKMMALSMTTLALAACGGLVDGEPEGTTAAARLARKPAAPTENGNVVPCGS